MTRQARTKSVGDQELLERVQTRIRKLYADGSITVRAGREYFATGARDRLTRLQQERSALWRKLGPAQVLGGVLYELRRQGKAYSFSPFVEWLELFLRATSHDATLLTGRYASRNRLMWLLWNFRHRAHIAVAKTEYQGRGSRVECPSCGDRHGSHRRRKDEQGWSRCPKCGEPTHRTVPEKLELRPFGKITKTGLMRRFRISRRNLDRLLRVPLP